MVLDNAQLKFKGVLFDTYQWQQKMYDGTTRTFEKIVRKDTVCVIPVTQNGEIIYLKERQPTRGDFYICFPGGSCEEGEDVNTTAARELLEETGYFCENFSPLSSYKPSSKIDYTSYTVVAKNCTYKQPQKLDGGEEIKVCYTDFQGFCDLLINGDYPFAGLRVQLLLAERNGELDLFKQKILG